MWGRLMLTAWLPSSEPRKSLSPQRDLCGSRRPRHRGLPAVYRPFQEAPVPAREGDGNEKGKSQGENKLRGVPAGSSDVFCVINVPNAKHIGLVCVALFQSGAGAPWSLGCDSLPFASFW